MSYLGLQYPDNTVLFNGTISTTGTGSALDTTGFVQSVWQVSGNTFSGIITAECSLDGVYWTPTFVTELSSLGQKTQIDVDGVYLVKADARYIRYNVQNISGTASLLILGNDYLSSNPVDRLSLAMDATNNTPLYVNVTNQLSQSLDNTPLFIGSVIGVGPGAPIDTTGYASVSIQAASIFSSSFTGIVTIEMSNDGVNWQPALVTQMDTMQLREQIDIMGTYVVKSVNRYIRYNVQNLTNAILFNILGKTSPGPSGADALSLAMDIQNLSPLYTAPMPGTGPKLDINNALILSDAPAAIPFTVNNNQPFTFDATGYQSIILQQAGAVAITVQVSNDGANYTPILIFQIANGVSGALGNTNTVGNTMYAIPVVGKYIRLTALGQNNGTIYLKNAPMSNYITMGAAGSDLRALNGTALVTGGVAGVLSVGGPNTTGTASTTNPLQVGGIDSSNLVRRALTDTSGRLQTLAYSLNPTILSSNAQVVTTTTAGGSLPPATLTGYNNNIPLSVGDTSQFEGQTQIEILALILQELKILNQQTYELPKIMAGMLNGYQTASYAPQPQYGDEPAQMRNDASLFIQQQ